MKKYAMKLKNYRNKSNIGGKSAASYKKGD